MVFTFLEMNNEEKRISFTRMNQRFGIIRKSAPVPDMTGKQLVTVGLSISVSPLTRSLRYEDKGTSPKANYHTFHLL